MSDLKPCPYCGGKARTNSYLNVSHSVSCLSCLFYAPTCSTKEEAADLWNEAVYAISAYRRTCEIVQSGFDDERKIRGWILSCGHQFDTDEKDPAPRFCPHCGARVVGE